MARMIGAGVSPARAQQSAPASQPLPDFSHVAGSLKDVYLFVRCHAWFVAINVTNVERIVMPTEVQILPPPIGGGNRPGHVGLAMASGRYYSGWDLGLMLEQPTLQNTWIMFQMPGPKGALPMALRTGTCLSVSTLKGSTISSVSGGMCRVRPGVFSGGYSAAKILARNKPLISVGLLLDLNRLWTADDLNYATKLLRESRVSR